jgi:hypothetical protein
MRHRRVEMVMGTKNNPDAAPYGRCRDCKWWAFEGECRRFPPTWTIWPNDNQPPVIYWPQSSFPPTGPDLWCGEYQARLSLGGEARAAAEAGASDG